ncbi:MAG: histidine--tRNA ligase [Candidatus Saccharibacteria bacterium]|nr:histidine--tRNA ligase [Candidatus Saccharibacteria bacterium]
MKKNKINTSPISGTQELLPGVQKIFDSLKTKIDETYKSHGFFNIETPSIERTEILLAKAGGDTEKQIYKVVKTAETEKEADQALRFDHTVPLARYIIEHENDLTFPLKVSQMGLNFRGERAQKGRFREFYQCDVDIIGRNSLSLAYDADIISTLLDAFETFNIKTPVLARINNRKILSGLLAALNLEKHSKEIYNIIDHSEKVTPEKTKLDLENLKISKENVKKLLNFIELNGERSKVVKELNNLEIKNETFEQGVAELDQVLYLLESLGLNDKISADMKIVRGLDYYTGTVFEFILPEHKSIGSVCGGGRYENLTGYFSDKSFPGVGGSIGLNRLFYVLNEKELLPKNSDTKIDYAVIPVSESEYDEALNVAKKLREKKSSVTVVLMDKKLGDKITYATKIAKNGIVIGENEVGSKNLTAKNYETGEETEINIEIISNPEDFWAN